MYSACSVKHILFACFASILFAALIAMCFSHANYVRLSPCDSLGVTNQASVADLAEDSDCELVRAGYYKEIDRGVEHDGSCDDGKVEVGARQTNNSAQSESLL